MMNQPIEHLQGLVDQATAILVELRAGLERLVAEDEGPTFERLGSSSAFEFKWPNATERYAKGSTWTVTSPGRTVTLTIGRTRREAWSRLRRRWVVFGPAGPRSAALYPWAEFVEADDGRMSAVIPSPESPRKILRAGDPIPARYRGQKVARADELFRSIANGGSLRVLVDDEEAAVRHAYYIAKLKGRI